MRNLTEPEPHKYRIYVVKADLTCNHKIEGRFIIPRPSGEELRIIACVGGGWDHVSVSFDNRIPTWDEMDMVARMFFKDDETAVQFHVPRSEHVNCHPFTLHLWRPHSKLRKLPRPPSWMV